MYTTNSSYFDNAEANPDIWANWIAKWNPADAQEIAESYWRNCKIIGINPELCISQASLETAHFTSYHYTNEHNMAGVGITGNDTIGYNFGSIEGGVKGHLAHLCAYIFTTDNNPQHALMDADSQWRDIRGGNDGYTPFNDGIPFIHTLEQPDVNNEGVHRWAASGWNYVPNIIAIANSVVGTPVPVQPNPPAPPVVFPVTMPSITENFTQVNVWNEGEWGGRSQYPIRAIVLHVMVGSLNGSVNWFHNPSAQASANYCIGYQGQIIHTVNEETQAPYANGISNGNNTALPPGLADLQWGHPNANFVTVSIETEGGSPDENGYPRIEEYTTVVSLMAWLCKKYNLHPSTDTICRHTYFDTVNRPSCPGSHWDFPGKLIPDVIAAMNIPTPVDPNDVHGVESADGQYRTFGFIPGSPTLGHSIYAYWRQDGVSEALWRYGYPLSNETTEARPDGSGVVCSWCERSRLEWHPEIGPDSVLEGLIGQEMLEYFNRWSVIANGAEYSPAAGPERTTLPIDTRIQSYYDKHGSLAHFGYPLTHVVKYPGEEMEGQWFERAFIEIHSDGLIVARRLGAEFIEARNNPKGEDQNTKPVVS